MVKCPFCHFENEDGALFCEQCKSDLGLAEAAGVQQEAEVAPHRLAEPAMPLAADVVDEVKVPEAEPLPHLAALEGVADDLAHISFPVAESVSEGAAETAPVAEVVAPVTSPQQADGDMAKTSPVPMGEVQAERPAPTAAATTPLPPGSKPKLVVLRGQRVNVEYPLYDGDNYVGRADEKPVDVDLEDQEPPDRIWSSRQHALISFEEGQLAIEDLNSTNGTFVNRTRVHPGQKRPLQVNDVIQIGTVQMKVKI